MYLNAFIFISIVIFLISAGIVVLVYFVKSKKVITCNRTGLQYKDWEMWDDSIRCFQKALDCDPSHALSHYNLGFVLYFGKNVADAAIKEFECTIALDKRLAPAYYALGHVQFHGKGKLEKAEHNLHKAIQLDTSLAQAHNTLGLIAIKKRDWKNAMDHFRTAVSINNTFESSYCNLSIALVYLGRNAEALEYSQKYAALSPRSVLAYNNLGNIYGACGMINEAVKALLISLSLNPDDWNVHFWLGCLRLQLNEYKKAVVSFYEALRLQGDFALAHYNLALCYERDSNKTLAKKHIERAVELDPALGENLI